MYLNFLKSKRKVSGEVSMNELSTKVTKLDLNFISDNCFKPALWDKTWTIFAYDGWKITFELQSINTKSKQVGYVLKLYKPNRTYNCQSGTGEINFQKEHRNLEVIQKGLDGKILRWLIEWEERNMIRETTAYIEADDYEQELLKTVKQKAEDLLDELGITNEEIRDAYIDSQENKYSTDEYTDKVFYLYKGTKLTKLYMSYCLFTGDKENYDKYKKIAKLNGFKIGDTRKEIKAQLDKIEYGDMYEELEMDEVM